MDFRSYKDEVEISFEQKEEMKEIIQSYEGMSDAQLKEKLIETYEKEKSQGKVDLPKLKEAFNNMSGYLTKEQKEKMSSMIAMLGDK